MLNVGAGTGSYEPSDRHVIAIEPSAAMRVQRPAHLSPAIHGIAEKLPLDDRSVDAAMATLTLHHWGDLEAGLAEVVRVTRGPMVVLTFDGGEVDRGSGPVQSVGRGVRPATRSFASRWTMRARWP